ncbi:MAG: hypothetical protein Q8941_00570, partial [Bacteroidota bacterium]|nr:hypothetical protein [Bacteroidota bacterium]
NPVAVSVETSNVKWNGRSHPRLKLVSNITIIDKSFEITVTGYNKQHVLQCTISSFDTSTCILQLAGKNTKLVDIQNTPIKVIVSSCPCDIKEINPGNNIGPINIVGAYKLDVKPADPPQHPYPFITVYFIRNMGSVPGMSVGPCVHQPPYSWPSIALPAVPMVLAFEAKDEEYTVVKEGTDNGFEIKVKPAKEDY